MKKNMSKTKNRICALAGTLLLGVTGVFGTYTSIPVQAAVTVNVDGNPQEWSSMKMLGATESAVEKWAVAKDDNYVYFYVQQNGLYNPYGAALNGKTLEISYEDGQLHAPANTIKFEYQGNYQFKLMNNNWGEYIGADIVSDFSKEKDKTEIEFKIPVDFFVKDVDYKICFSDDSRDYNKPMSSKDNQDSEKSISSKEIPHLAELDSSSQEVPKYEGIKVDGSFGDWDAIEKTHVNKGPLQDTAVVFDGDFYIYLKENAKDVSNGTVGWTGEYSNGRFAIVTDTGRTTSFTLTRDADSLENIKGSEIKYSNFMYEIRIPREAIKDFKNTVSFGYYMGETLIADVADMKEENTDTSDRVSPKDEVVIDGNYTDWKYFDHALIQYSTAGDSQWADDGFQTLFSTDDGRLIGHVECYRKNRQDGYELGEFTIRINNDQEYMFNVVEKTASGYRIPDWKNVEKDTVHEYYLRWTNAQCNLNDSIEKNDEMAIVGKVCLTTSDIVEGASRTCDQMEWEMDQEKLAKVIGVPADSMKEYASKYHRIGQNWYTASGGSTGAVMGISICCLVVLGVLVYRKRKTKVA
ncbi:MAG: hypothetical protein HFI75_05160 [Lachnospiraceae bacterium]|nr:hypothetical protein [Lachnospiraceae bacterium]